MPFIEILLSFEVKSKFSKMLHTLIESIWIEIAYLNTAKWRGWIGKVVENKTRSYY